jgi:outer membrane protein
MTRRLLLVLLVLAVVPLFAADQKLGYIYSDKIIQDYQGMAEANAALAKEKTAFRTRADSLYQALTKAKADLNDQKLMLSEDGKAAKNSEVEALQRSYDSYLTEVYGPSGKLEQKTQEIMTPVIQKVKEAVERVAKAEGFTIVFDATESKLAILYALSGANLTQEVSDDLNREFKPVTPLQVADKRYAVFPPYESNDEAQQENVGEQCRSLLYEFVRTQPRIEMVTQSEVTTALSHRSITGKSNITPEIAFATGKELLADYVLYGTVAKTGKKTTATVSIADPRLNQTFATETATANRVEDLRQTLGNIVQKLLRKLPQQ